MKKVLITFIVVIMLLLSCSLASEAEGNIIILDDFTGTIQETDPGKPYKPEHLSEVGKTVIGLDNREIITDPDLYPFSAIAYMDVTSSCSHDGWYGSGFMIGSNLLLTAGHCVFCPECHAPAQEISFYFGYINERNYLACNRGSNWSVYVPRQVAEGKDYNMCDYAIFQLNEDIGEKTGYFSMRYDIPDDELTGLVCHVTGYRDGILKHDMEKVNPQNKWYLVHYADMEPGNSGCPVYDEDNYVIAINSAEAEDGAQNYAVRITADIYGQIEKYGKRQRNP